MARYFKRTTVLAGLWLLSGGIWNDGGVWKDSAVWEDS